MNNIIYINSEKDNTVSCDPLKNTRAQLFETNDVVG